jgi:SAM-dependent methyltransferase
MPTEFNMNMFMGDEAFIKSYQEKYARLFPAGSKVLDVGCGEGYFLELLAARGVEGIGLDHSVRAIEICRNKGMQVIEGEPFTALPEARALYDGIFCCHVIEHFAPERVRELMRLILSSTKPGGLLILVTPNMQSIEVLSEIFWRDPTHVRPYPRVLVEELLRYEGFEIHSSGTDPDTRRRMPRRNLLLALKYLLKKIRFGEYYGCGDTFVIGRRPSAASGAKAR